MPGPARRLRLALLVIATVQLMVTLDATIVTVALPSIRGALRMADADLNWVITAYALAFGGLVLVGGRSGDLFGRRRVFRLGLVVFLLSSLLGGVATTGAVLVAARAGQGVGAAIVAPATLSMLAATFPAGPQRNRALGVYAGMGALGAVAGLLLGGVLTEVLSWRWVLFVNIPIALAILAGSGMLVGGDRQRGRVDLPGAIAVTLGLGSLVFAINQANQQDWTDPAAAATGAAAVVLLLAFAVIQRRSSAPMMPRAVLADRGRAGAYLIMGMMGAGMFATTYFLTLYMQGVKSYSPIQTGLAFVPFAASIGVGSGVIGPRLLARTSARSVSVAGMLLAAVGMAWFGLLAPDQSAFAVLLPAQLVTGLGVGLGAIAAAMTGMQGVASTETGIASGLINTAQQVGGAVGLAVLAVVAAQATNSRLPQTAVPDALTDGYATGILAGAGFYLVGILVAALTLGAPAVRAGPAARIAPASLADPVARVPAGGGELASQSTGPRSG